MLLIFFCINSFFSLVALRLSGVCSTHRLYSSERCPTNASTIPSRRPTRLWAAIACSVNVMLLVLANSTAWVANVQ
ncbi:hypothetical protein F5Y06DRAFT_283821 [Hypoxylon sp. FL0890]|nr:hypothetical protein F5Y06DRAFT_283821 [Hypoxylon sp. FL0890]